MRTLADHPVMGRPPALSLYILLLFRARYRPDIADIGGEVIELGVGQCVFGRKEAAKALGLTEREVRTAQRFLEKTGLIERKATNRGTIVTVCHYKTWERRETDERPTDDQPTNYGGERVWFLCPHCSRRVAVLYGAGAWFLCRHCYRLPYSSQQETYADRMRRKARKIRERLGASADLREPFWRNPQGMHWRTFERLAKKEEAANEAATRAWAKQVKMLMGWDEAN